MGIQQVKNTPQAQESDTPMESKPLFKKMDPTLLLDQHPKQQLMPEPQEDTPNKLDQKQPQEHSINTTQQEHTKAQKQEKPQSQEIFAKEEKNQTTTTSYTKGKTGVRRYDYPGMDDGSRCPQRGGKRRGRKVKGSCGMNPDTNRCARGFSNENGWCELGGKKGTRKSPNMKRRCVANPLARRFLGMPKAKKASPKPRRSKRLAKKAAKKSPKKAAKKSPKKAKKSPKKAKKSPKKAGKSPKKA